MVCRFFRIIRRTAKIPPYPPPRALTARTPAALTAPARLPAEVLKLQDFSFYQSISSFVVSLPNVSEKDVKGLLFRK